ncbi:MAG: polysaccharide deacetylase family protein, partial [Pseudomonas sp.]|uniref:polysaccharide deacetylase family protein n=1 Tax=Pseudomonas sp. TaxID=306 RepID=UPI003D10AA7F
HPDDPYNTFDWLMDVSEANNLKSAFYFICGCTDKARDADYEPDHPIIRSLMWRIHKRGHEIGLHPSYGTYQQSELIGQEALRLKRICAEEGIEQDEWGGRMHYLRWEHPTTLRAWVDAGMDYDSTLGYADRPGFRCGSCFDYPAFDPIAQQKLMLRVRPLVMMECTVIDAVYLGFGVTEAAEEKIRLLKERCRDVGGGFTILWHNSYFFQKGLREMYVRILSC